VIAAVRAWNSGRATIYGAIIGAVAAALKMFGPWAEAHTRAESIREIVGAALAFALLCAGATALRNLVARRVIWRENRSGSHGRPRRG